MSKKSNHHYVPQFYFRLFSRDGSSICLLKKDDGSRIDSASIKGQASKKKFYGLEEIESQFAIMEELFSKVIKKINFVKRLDEFDQAEISLILQAIMFQHSRTYSFRDRSAEANNKLMRLFLEAEINSKEDLSDKEKIAHIEALDLMELDPVRPHLESILMAVNQCHHLGDLTPLILQNKTVKPYIFSDTPVVIHNSYYGDVKCHGVLGFMTPGLQVFFPISEKRVLLLIDSKNYLLKGIRGGNIINVRYLNDVAMINKLQIHSATSSVYYSDRTQGNYIHHLWKEERNRFKSNSIEVNEYPVRPKTEQEHSELLHTFQPLLPIKLKLSFIKHKILGDDDYFIETRGYNDH